STTRSGENDAASDQREDGLKDIFPALDATHAWSPTLLCMFLVVTNPSRLASLDKLIHYPTGQHSEDASEAKHTTTGVSLAKEATFSPTRLSPEDFVCREEVELMTLLGIVVEPCTSGTRHASISVSGGQGHVSTAVDGAAGIKKVDTEQSSALLQEASSIAEFLA
ncbi:unnamed protein product, partial [Amoebophrya sp. A25]